MDKNKESLNARTRTFPIMLLIVSGILSSVISAYGGLSAIALSLGYLMFTMSFFLIHISVFHKIKMLKLRRAGGKPSEEGGAATEGSSLPSSRFWSALKTTANDVWMRLTRFYLDERASPGSEEAEETKRDAPAAGADTPAYPGGLFGIKKAPPLKQSQETAPKGPRYEVLYVISFIAIAVWRLSRMFTIVPLAQTQFSYNIVDAVLLLVFPCVAITYLKMRKNEGSCPGDKTSYHLLTLLSYVSLVYAAVIAAALVLGADILPVLQWLFYAAMVYFIAALAVNILLSVLANKIIGDFNYPLIPNLSRDSGARERFLDSEDVRLNFSLKSLYTIKYTLQVLPGLVLGLIFILLLSTSIFVVHPHQKAAVYRSGRLSASSIVGEGIHFKRPWPIDRAAIYDVYRISSMQIGYIAFDDPDFLWAHFHGGGDHLLLLGNGNEKVSVNMRVMYHISDLYAYLTTSADPRALLSAAAYEALFNRTVNTTLDAFLNIDRSSLSASILEELSALSAAERLGLSVVQIIIEGIHPPAEVAEVYQMVISASIDKNTIITTAETEAERRLIDADRQSRSIVNYAQARQYYRISAALQEMAVFHAAMEAHQISGESFELARYLEVFERVIEGSKVFVFSPGMEGSMHRSVIGQLNARGIVEF